jgi:hypothetical protein
MIRRLGIALAVLCFIVFVMATIQASAAWSMARGPFTNAVTRGLGAKVTLHTRRAFAAELQAEGGEAKNNPFNTTISAPGATCYNIVPCVKNYPTPKIGIEATIRTLKENGHGYEKIRRPVILNAPATRIVRGFGESEWGTNLELVLAVLDDIRHDRFPNTLSFLEARQIAN